MKALQVAPRAGDEVDKELGYSFMDRKFVEFVSPGARWKLPVPKLYEPVTHRGPATSVVAHLFEEMEAFRVILEYANEKQLKGLRVRSPAGSLKPLGACAYLDATGSAQPISLAAGRGTAAGPLVPSGLNRGFVEFAHPFKPHPATADHIFQRAKLYGSCISVPRMSRRSSGEAIIVLITHMRTSMQYDRLSDGAHLLGRYWRR